MSRYGLAIALLAAALSALADGPYRSETVASAKRALKERGYKSVRQFQKAEEIPVSGHLDSETLAALGILSGEPSYSADLVKRVQSGLRRHGYHPGPMDGILGEETRAAIRKFQHSEYLQATGLPDRRTVEALTRDSS